jgi:Invasin, domain 3
VWAPSLPTLAVRDRGPRFLLAVILTLPVAAALAQPAHVTASGALGPSQPSHYGETGPPRLVRPQDLRAPLAGSRPSIQKPLLLRDPHASAAQRQLVIQGKTGRRDGVVTMPPSGVAGAISPQPEQKLSGFPVMDLQRQETLFGADQGVEPPDTQLAAGPTYLVEATNSSLSAWSKSGSLMTSVDLNVFFAVPAPLRLSDPRILYDAESGRWFLSGLAFDANNNSVIYIAASQTSDPTAIWEIYRLSSAVAILQDQPMIGVSTDKVVISWNDFTGSSNATAVFSGEETWVLQKSDLVAAATLRFQSFPQDPTRFRVVPAQLLTPTATQWLTYNNADCQQQPGCSAGSPTVGVLAITGTPAGNNILRTESDLAIRATTAPPSPRQPSGTPVVSLIDDNFLSAVFQNGILWTAGNDSCVPGGDSAMRSCMKLVAISTAGASPTVAQDFDGGANGTDLYYPAVTLDSSGNLFVAFTESSPSEFPTAATRAIRAATPGTFENAITIEPGLGSYLFPTPQGGNRWGDYSAAATDPSNPAVVWVTAEYQASATVASNWGTATARVTIQPPSAAFTPATPQRLLDTRVTGGRLGPGGTQNLTVAGGGTGAPAGASAVVLNVTVTNTTAASFLTAYPAGTAQPLASNLNWVGGQTVPNLVTVPVGNADQVAFFNGFGSADLVVDLEGYFAAPTGAAGEFQPLTPARVLDTRTANGAPTAKVGPAQTLNLQVTGRGGLPATGVSAVVMNVTVTNPSAAGYLTVFPTGAAAPLASNLNFTAGETVPNRVIVGVGASGQVSIFNGAGSTDVIADVGGYFTDSSTPGQLFSPLSPFRLLDTRSPKQTLGPNGTLNLSMLQAAVPADATAVILNVTATGTTAASFFTVFPAGAAQPVASDLNWVAGKTVPNLDVVKLGAGSISLFNQFGSADAIVDILGYFSPPPVSVSANPSSLPADGTSTSVVTVTVTKPDGTPASSDSVTFTSGGGVACGAMGGSPVMTNASGIATVTYTASTTAGSCNITATEATDNLSGSITITQTIVANSITETATPPSVPADGKTTSSITSTVTNRVSGSVNGDVVTYALSPNPVGSCGTLSVSSATTGGGGTTPAVTYTASSISGVCTITATESSTGSSGTTAITQT